MTHPSEGKKEFSLFMAAFMVFWTLRSTLFYAVDESIASPVWRGAYSDFLKFFFWVLPAAVYAMRWRKAKPIPFLGLSLWPDRRTWGVCLGATAAFLSVVAFFEIGAGGKHLSGEGLKALSPSLWVLQLLASPWLEEIFFRGFVLKELRTFWNPGRANAAAALLFAAVHLPFWLSHGGFTPGLAANLAGVFLFGLLAGWLYGRSESVWPPTLAHVGNNVLSLCLVL